jgi:hypothetical protein
LRFDEVMMARNQIGVLFQPFGHALFQVCLDEHRVFQIAEFAAYAIQRGIDAGISGVWNCALNHAFSVSQLANSSWRRSLQSNPMEDG